MTLVPPERMAQVVGLSATIAFAFVLSAWCAAPRLRRMPVAAVSAVLAGVATILGGLELRDALPELPAWVVVIVGVLVALAILAVVWHPASPRALAVLPVLALVVVFAANPLQRGLGDLRGSTAAETVGAASDRLGDGEYLAADSLEVDALLMSNGVPALSGQQWLGPDEEAWRVLDPSGRSRSAWNRGASYVVFDWAPGETTDHPGPCRGHRPGADRPLRRRRARARAAGRRLEPPARRGVSRGGRSLPLGRHRAAALRRRARVGRSRPYPPAVVKLASPRDARRATPAGGPGSSSRRRPRTGSSAGRR